MKEAEDESLFTHTDELDLNLFTLVGAGRCGWIGLHMLMMEEEVESVYIC